MSLPPLWDYQSKAVHGVIDCWRRGVRRPLLVAPTGAGKTRMGLELVRTATKHKAHVLWMAHRDELVDQAARVVEQLDVPVGLVAAGKPSDPNALVQVASIQTLVARGDRPDAVMVVFDEAHHYAAAEWGSVAQHYTKAAVVGLTATPERGDGRPMGDLFDELVVAAHYPELVKGGQLVPCRVFRPDEALGQGLAQDPVAAYLKHGEGRQGFVFCGTVEQCKEVRDRFEADGVTSEVISESTPKADRAAYLRAFRRGEVRLIVNVYTMTEGVDVPQASCVVLARGVGHVTPYLQMCGRGLRAAPGKKDCVLLDLSGASYQHGLPTERRDYSLTKGIVRNPEKPLRVCIACGMTYEGGGKCPRCGFVQKAEQRKRPVIYDMILREVYDFEHTPDWAKQRELERLMTVKEEKKLPMAFVVKEYERMFGERPVIASAESDVARAEYDSLVKQALTKGYSIGWASYRFKHAFGAFPPRAWLEGKRE